MYLTPEKGYPYCTEPAPGPRIVFVGWLTTGAIQLGQLEILGTEALGVSSKTPVVQTLDSAIHAINHYPADYAIVSRNNYPLDTYLSGG